MKVWIIEEKGEAARAVASEKSARKIVAGIIRRYRRDGWPVGNRSRGYSWNLYRGLCDGGLMLYPVEMEGGAE